MSDVAVESSSLEQAASAQLIGQLAGGIAHDFRNILLVIRGYSAVLRAQLDDPQQLQDIDEIEKAADRAAALTDRLLALGRTGSRAPRELSLCGLVGELESIVRNVVGCEVDVVIHLDETAPAVCAEPAELERVLLNLVANARDAMSSGGTLTVSVDPTRLGAEVSVSDTGTGIDDRDLPSVFDPFFSTKGPAGTGLGLWMARELVERNGGELKLESARGAGTTATVSLPRYAAE